jgi:NAD(P)-dependent dehydrogenase (short-subunit alcohol dehydrogenase family)
MTHDVYDVQGRSFVVTGGLGQLGTEFTRELASRGARVTVLDVDVAESKRPPLPADIRDRVSYVAADIRERAQLERALVEIERRSGVPDGLINNAAIDSPPDAPASENGPFEDYPLESWDRILDVNLTGTFLCCQVFGGRMARAGRGTIVNISSIYGIVSPDQRIYEYRRKGGAPFIKPVAYSASKSGLLNLTRYLATYWAPSGVRVNTLTLAGVFRSQDRAFLDGYTARMPMGRMAQPDEYNGAIVFLCSDASRYMTGSNLVIDGGWTAW